jgi:RNA polymerase sigma-70 factor (ECF subfamily)
LVPNWADAEDIAQEVKIRLWEQFSGYDPAKDFGAWARTIAYYQVLTYRQRLSRRRRLLSDRSLDAVAEEVASMDEELEAAQHALADCFEKLPEAKREMLLKYYSGLSTTRQLAEEAGRSFDATRQAILRARLSLRVCIEKALHKEDGP